MVWEISPILTLKDRVKFYCSEILLGLEYLHHNGIMYRDLKPENILINQDGFLWTSENLIPSGHVYLTDFGISKSGVFTDTMKAQTFCGTAEYLGIYVPITP